MWCSRHSHRREGRPFCLFLSKAFRDKIHIKSCLFWNWKQSNCCKESRILQVINTHYQLYKGHPHCSVNIILYILLPPRKSTLSAVATHKPLRKNTPHRVVRWQGQWAWDHWDPQRDHIQPLMGSHTSQQFLPSGYPQCYLGHPHAIQDTLMPFRTPSCHSRQPHTVQDTLMQF